jgi:uncharacterized protein (DUF488 family)
VCETSQLTIFTIGHSTRTPQEFIDLLAAYKIRMVVDVRSYPHSRHNPQFNKDPLAETLQTHGVKYLHMPELGGMRRPNLDSVNLAWKNKTFRGYADYMQTREFVENLLKLIALAKGNCLAVMCAEAVPWRCHRNLLSDALVVRKIRVKHILTATSYTNHELNPSAHVEGTAITYPLFHKEKPQRTLTDFT